MSFQLIPNGNLRSDYETYKPWPNFQPIGSVYLGGLWRAHFLKEILTSDELTCAAWREPIPSEILRTLRLYPECHCEFIAMAQSAPEYFLELTRRNPALAMIAATFWCFRSFNRVPSIERKVIFWENMDDHEILQFCRFPTSRSFLKALAKIPAGHVYIHRIMSLRDLWAQPEKRRILQHLPVITGENIWLLSCYPPILDPAIHQLAASEPEHEEFSILEIISDLTNRRELACLEAWPYRNLIHSWPQLLAAYNKFLKKTNCVVEVFPPPPIGEYEDEEIHIVPLKSRTALDQEGKAMLNCIEGFSSECSRLKHYAYRLLRPERATVLIKRQYRHWIIDEAMIRANERQVRSATMKLLCRWVRTRPDN